jgi:hypothetical protein
MDSVIDMIDRGDSISDIASSYGISEGIVSFILPVISEAMEHRRINEGLRHLDREGVREQFRVVINECLYSDNIGDRKWALEYLRKVFPKELKRVFASDLGFAKRVVESTVKGELLDSDISARESVLKELQG